jgi:hypothetical protein
MLLSLGIVTWYVTLLRSSARTQLMIQEVEMLPTLLAVGHNHFPGIFDAVYVVNAGWTHRSMWGVIKRVLPKSALDKIIFLDKQVDLERVFDLESLPKGKSSMMRSANVQIWVVLTQ